MAPSLIALVTGANRGIGLEVCRQLAEAGMRVLLGARDPVKGEATARGLAQAVEPVALDVTDAASIRALQGRLAAVDVLVNNAGVDYERTRPRSPPISRGCAGSSTPICSAPGRWRKPSRRACAGVAGGASSM